jgi:type VI secretion system secreted protein Hcp
MAQPCYMTLTDASGNAIQGSCTIKGHENAVLVEAIEHLIDVPRNPQTGLATGPRQHLGLKVTKQVDKSSPMLMAAMCSAAQLQSITLQFPRVSKEGKEEVYYTIVLSKANVVLAKLWMANCLKTENRELSHMEDVCFTYEKITWTWAEGNVEAEDDWTKPKQ